MPMPTPSSMVHIILPIVGIGIIVFCVLSFFLPYGANFRGKVQKIKGFGVDLEVSVVALFIIVGVGMSFAGIYLEIKNFEERLALADQTRTAARTQRDLAMEALRNAKQFHINAFVTLAETTAASMPKLEDVEGSYHPWGEDPIKAVVTKGLESNQFRIILEDVTRETVIRGIVIEDRATGRKWKSKKNESFSPLEPSYALTLAE